MSSLRFEIVALSSLTMILSSSCMLDLPPLCESSGDCPDGQICQLHICLSPGDEDCADGEDNDGDGDKDCMDADCQGQACGDHGRICMEERCACPDDREICDDGVDNDCDGTLDCEDEDCTFSPLCVPPRADGGHQEDLPPLSDRAAQDSAPPSDEGHRGDEGAPEDRRPPDDAAQAPENCQDGLDNDNDGLIDCQDPTCEGQPCGNGWVCLEGSCLCPTKETTEVLCHDELDNDCDGSIDCFDEECEGRSCSSTGKVCQDDRCICPFGDVQETLCDDGQDNDCDGTIDCLDSSCQGRRCGNNGLTCLDFLCLCPGGEETETTCGDSQDNDCDGRIDCADTDCDGISCGDSGFICLSGFCRCPGEASETLCDDGVDNDCDGKADCEDPNCDGQICGERGQACQGGACLCPGPETETGLCDDGVDNDCDGLVDCLDTDCEGSVCGPHSLVCLAGECHCPGGESQEASCADGEDNDCDGLVDCQDEGCSARPCGPSGALCLNDVCFVQGCLSELPGYCFVPPGPLTMGSPPTEAGHGDDEDQHEVTITRGFYLKGTEVTQGEWLVHRAHPSINIECGMDCPVGGINWWESLEYMNALSLGEGLGACYSLRGCEWSGESYSCTEATFGGLGCEGYRLPTEAEWEHAARSGSQGGLCNGDIVSNDCAVADAHLDEVAWYCANAHGQVHAVGTREPNAWGLHDMHGNVEEWVWDRYSARYPTALQVDPLGPLAGTYRVYRGGHYSSNAQSCRSAKRNYESPARSFAFHGLRPARTWQP